MAENETESYDSLAPANPTVPPALPWKIEDRYTIVAEIGHGSHAIVYRAIDRMLEREVAIKVLRAELVDSDIGERFRREIRLTSQLAHPNIAHVYGTGEFMGSPYFVIELARGRSLAERLAIEPQLPVDEAFAITRQVASALGHAHRAGIIHRDVKPANILLTPDGALLTDFGVARAIDAGVGTLATSTGTAVGTLLYMSPEQLCAEKHIDGRSDQYELALVLYELLAGVPPHVAANAEGLRGLRIVGRHAPVRTHRPSVPLAVEQAIDRALCPTPADRFASMGDFVAAMDGGAGSEGMRVSAARGAIDAVAAAPVAPRGRVRRWIVPAVAVSAAAALALNIPRLARARGAAMPIVEDSASTTLAPRFHVMPTGDTARSALIARAVVEELAAWPSVEASSDDAGGGARTSVQVRAIPIRGGVQVVLEMRAGTGIRAVQVRLPTAATDNADSLRILAARALMATAVSPDSALDLTNVRGRPSQEVFQFARGWSLVRAGAMQDAEEQFALAARTGLVPQAALWHALVASWRKPRTPMAWRDAARRASMSAAALTRSDSLLAVALELRAADGFVDACSVLKDATGIAGGTFQSWYSLGDCLRIDSVVVPDAASLTGYRFRAASWGALAAYEEAVRRLPSAGLVALFDHLPRTAMALNGSVRRGVKAKRGGGMFAGFASISGDSTVVLPFPIERFTAGGSTVVPPTYQQATRLARARLLRITNLLSQKAPESFAARFSYARALELAGILQRQPGEASALAAFEQASAAARSKLDSIEVASAIVRVRMSLNDFVAARAAAIRLLSTVSPSTADEAARLAVIALLVNRTWSAESLFTRALSAASDNPDGLPLHVAAALARYHVAAASAECRDTRALRATALDALGARSSQQELPAAIDQWITPADWSALSCAGSSLPADLQEGDVIAQAHRALAAGRPAMASRMLRERAGRRGGASESTLAWDTRELEIALYLRAADSIPARRSLAVAFKELGATMDYVLHDFSQVAGLRRSLNTCASLAAGQPVALSLAPCRDALSRLDGYQAGRAVGQPQ